LSEAVLELNARFPSGRIEVRLDGRDPSLVLVEDEQTEPQMGAVAGRRVGADHAPAAREPEGGGGGGGRTRGRVVEHLARAAVARAAGGPARAAARRAGG
jgi:hypothetical protein